MRRVVAHRDGVSSLADLQHNIHAKRAVGVKRDSGAAVGFEARVVHFENIVSNGEDRERVSTPPIGGSRLPSAGTGIDQTDG